MNAVLKNVNYPVIKKVAVRVSARNVWIGKTLSV